MRVFVAVPLPAETVTAIGAWMEPLKREYGDLRWVRKQQLHLTLRFLGDVDGQTVARVGRILDRASPGPVSFSIDRAGSFGGRDGGSLPSVYWLSGCFDPALDGLAAALRAVPDDRGRVDTRPFRPHITIARRGRCRRSVPIGQTPPGPWTGRMDRVLVYNSNLTPAGPEYDVLESHMLAGADRNGEQDD